MSTHDGWTGKVAAITGGNSGIGRAAARRFASLGAHVAILGRDPATVCETQHELPDALAFVGASDRLTISTGGTTRSRRGGVASTRSP